MGDSVMRRRPPLRGDLPKVEQEIYVKPEEIDGNYKIIDEDKEFVDRARINAMFNNVSMSDSESLFESLLVIKNYLEEKLLVSASHTRKILLYTFAKSLEERSFAVKAGALYGMIHGMKIREETVRYLLLTSIQKELEENNFQDGNRWRFLNAVFLLSELYYHIRFDDNPISILGGELIKYFRWLLTGDENEIEILAIGLILNGPTLKKDKPASYRKLLIEIRIALVTRDLIPTCRSWLLLILDADGVNFEKLREDTLIFHLTFIGDRGFKKLKWDRPTSKSCANNKSFVSNSLPHSQNSDALRMTLRQHYVEQRTPRTTSPVRPPSPEESSPEWQSSNRRSCGRCSHDRRHSSDEWRSPDQPNISDRRRSPEPLQHPKEPPKSILKSPRQSSNEYKLNDFKSNDLKSNDYKSNDLKSNDFKSSDFKSNDYKSNDSKLNDHKSHDFMSNNYKSNDNKSHNYKSNDYKCNDFKSSDSANRPGRSEGRYQHYQPQGNTSQKSYPGKWSADGAGLGGKKIERRIPPWREHDDRFERNYEN